MVSTGGPASAAPDPPAVNAVSASIRLIHAGQHLLAVDKPPGVPVIPARHQPAEASLHRRLQAARGERLWVVHRIDSETSGLVVFARDPAAHRELSMAFQAGRVAKTYMAFACGRLPGPAGAFDLALHAARRGRMRPARAGDRAPRAAYTRYRVERQWRKVPHPPISMLRLEPKTGRQHQIRIHLRAAGAPILGDRLYGMSVQAVLDRGVPCARLALHAFRLTIPATRWSESLQLEAPLAEDLILLIDWLDRHWQSVPGPR
jgi:RluA family pseudouridine synthase